MDILQTLVGGLLNGQGSSVVIDGVKQTMTAEQIEGILREFLQSDAGKRLIAQKKKEGKLKDIEQTLGQITGLSGDIADIITSKEQLELAREGLRSLEMPDLPPVLQVDPALEQEIRETQQGTLEQPMEVAAARGAIDQNYREDLARAQSMGAGQAASTAALSQLASNRRNQSELGLANQSYGIRNRERSRLQSLLRDRQSQRRDRNRGQVRNFGYMEDRFNRDAEALGNLHSTAMLNRRQSWRNLGNRVSQLPSSLGSIEFPSSLSSLFKGSGQGLKDSVNSGDILGYEGMLDQNLGLGPQELEGYNYGYGDDFDSMYGEDPAWNY